MKHTSALATAFLATRPSLFYRPDCFTITLANGNIYRWTNFDIPVTAYDNDAVDAASGALAIGVLGSFTLGAMTGLTPQVFAANGPRFDGLRSSVKIGLAVDEQTVTVSYATPDIFLAQGSAIQSGVLNSGQLGQMLLGGGAPGLPTFGQSQELIEGVPFGWAFRDGVFDGAFLQRDVAIMPAWDSPAIGMVTMFYGRISTIESFGRTEAKFKVKSEAVLLDEPMPRNVYQASCRYTLFGPGCELNKADFAVGGTVLAGSTPLSVNWANPKAAGYFSQGTITFTSGALNGVRATVKQSTSGTIVVIDALPVAPATGDTFNAYPGCDHSMGANGCGKFDNLKHFGGFPRVPPPTTAL